MTDDTTDPTDGSPEPDDVEGLFQRAVDLPPDERDAFLDARCPPGTSRRREVEKLLRHFDDAEGHFLEGPLPDLGLSPVFAETAPPERIGDYAVIDRLGQGGMGVVYLARDPRLEREVAIKVLPPIMAADQHWQRRIQSEARLLASVNHPNIATIYSLEEAEGERFLTMERVRGESLAQRLARESLPLLDTLSIAQQVASALEAAHRQGVVHRDLKPDNIMITGDGRVKVLDFGIASSVHAADGPAMVRAVGTPGYMSPEQIRGEPIDPRTDIWAFGCLLYECLAGLRAFPERPGSDPIAATLQGELDWRCLPASVPDSIRSLLEQCLAPSARERLGVVAQARRRIEEEIAVRAHRAPPTVPSLDVPNNLPASLSTFVGREAEIADVGRLLREHVVVTLTGSGGCGKSRLALEVARTGIAEWTDGAWFVELAPISDPASVKPAIAAALGLREHPGQSVAESILSFLRDRHLLLILDNCEHVIAEVADVATLVLRSCPGVRILATSRERLSIDGETIYQTPALGLPDTTGDESLSDVIETESVRLFLDRARIARRDFNPAPEDVPALVQICRRLDGIPLALELAAARVAVLTIEEIAERLDDRFRFLTSKSKSALPQHKTLLATIEWSHQLLDENEQVLLRRLAVFAGGWTLRTAETVCAGSEIEGWEILDLHTQLVEKSLVDVDVVRTPGRARYRMLETVKAYSLDRMRDAGELDEIASRHCAAFTKLAERAERELRGPDQGKWLSTLEREHDNLRRALRHAFEHDTDTGLRLAAALGRFWAVRGHWKEGRGFLRRALEADRAAALTLSRASCVSWAGTIARIDNDLAEAQRLFEECLSMGQALGDRRTVATALSNLGHLAQMRGDFLAARSRYEECLAVRRELGNTQEISTSLTSLGMVAIALCEFDRARVLYEENLEISREIGDLSNEASALLNLSQIASREGDRERAHELIDRALSIGREVGDRRFIAVVLQSRGAQAFGEERWADSYADYSETMAIREELGDRRGVGHALSGLGYISYLRGDTVLARSQLDDSLARSREADDPAGMAYALCGLGYVSTEEGDLDYATEMLAESLRIRHEITDLMGLAVSLEGLGVVASVRGEMERAIELFSAADTIRERVSFPLTTHAQHKRELCLAAARAALGNEAFEDRWESARSVPVETIVERVLRPGR